jgi:predicted RND superfamily exporter protein
LTIYSSKAFGGIAIAMLVSLFVIAIIIDCRWYALYKKNRKFWKEAMKASRQKSLISILRKKSRTDHVIEALIKMESKSAQKLIENQKRSNYNREMALKKFRNKAVFISAVNKIRSNNGSKKVAPLVLPEEDVITKTSTFNNFVISKQNELKKVEENEIIVDKIDKITELKPDETRKDEKKSENQFLPKLNTHLTFLKKKLLKKKVEPVNSDEKMNKIIENNKKNGEKIELKQNPNSKEENEEEKEMAKPKSDIIGTTRTSNFSFFKRKNKQPNESNDAKVSEKDTADLVKNEVKTLRKSSNFQSRIFTLKNNNNDEIRMKSN